MLYAYIKNNTITYYNFIMLYWKPHLKVIRRYSECVLHKVHRVKWDLVVQKLVKVTLLSPREELSKVTTKLSNFEMFHAVKEGLGSPSDSNLDDLAIRALRVFLDLDEILKGLDIKEVGLIETLTKGNKIEKEKIKIKD
mgnify:CR=1 FL=1